MTSFSPVKAQGQPVYAPATSPTRLVVRSGSLGPLFASFEILALTATGIAGNIVYRLAVSPASHIEIDAFAAPSLLMALLYFALLQPHRAYRLEKLVTGRLRRPLTTWLLVFLFFTSVAFALKIGEDFSRGGVLSGFMLGLLTIALLRSGVSPLIRWAVDTGRLEGTRIVLIGDPDGLAAMGGRKALGMRGYRVLAAFHAVAAQGRRHSAHPEPSAEEQLERCLGDVTAFARSHAVDEIFVALPTLDEQLSRRALDRLRILPLRVSLVPDAHVCRLLAQPMTRLGSACAFEFQRAPLTNMERSLKRAFDVVASAAALIALAPLFAAIAVIVKLDSPGPVFFRQTRIGFSGRPFRIFKFRSMTTQDDGAVVKQASRNDRRVTASGRWLRQSSLDELPQLINVLLGHMSLIGPRPHALAHDDEYDRLIATYAFRHHVKPGITGWAQVHGYRGETPTIDLMERRVEHDLWYIANWSFWLDLRTLLLTVREVFQQRNAY